MKRVLSFLLSLVLILSVMPFSASAATSAKTKYAKTITVKLKVKDGADIADVFNEASARVKDTKRTLLKIFVPKGSYVCSTQLRVWSNTEVYFNGATITHTGEGVSLMRMGIEYEWEEANGGKGYPGYSGGRHIKLVGGILDGGNKSDACVRFGHMQDLTFINMVFTNVYNSHHVELGGCKDILFDHCVFSEFHGDFATTQNHEALQFDATVGDGGNRYHFGAYPPEQDDTPCKNVIVKNCVFKNLQRGMGTHAGSANTYFDKMMFIDNTFVNITGYGIIATAYTNSVIAGNTMKNCGAGIYFRALESGHGNFYEAQKHSSKRKKAKNCRCVIKNNTIQVTRGYQKAFANVAYGIQLYGEKLKKKDYNTPPGDWRLSGVSITGNQITMQVTGYAIWGEGLLNSSIKKNKITCKLKESGAGGNGDGIRLTNCHGNKINQNSIVNETNKGGYDSEMSGVNLFDCYKNVLYRNVVKNAKKDGFKMENCVGNAFIENTAGVIGRDAVHMTDCSKNAFRSNTFIGIKRDGVNSDNCSGDVYQENTLTKMGRRAFEFNNVTAVKVLSNSTSESGEDGVCADGTTQLTIDGNTFTDQGRDGIRLEDTSKTVITSNTITNSTRFGINATAGQISTDSGNKISGSGKKNRSWK